ncbi:MAG: DNA methyltransferase [Candidatus Uhrbacteria bacterium]|nr:DNA methyltransferase [Candidatus Uhrbacteria bacterium]
MKKENKMWELINGDCIREMHSMAENGRTFDLAVYSPPFASLYTYSNSDSDMGNSRDSDDEFLLHHRFFVDALLPVIKPGRNVCVHIANPTRTKASHGYMGIWDLRGEMIKQYESAGFIYYGEITVDKNPQAQAIRTKAHALMFISLDKDSAIVRPAIADYVMVFKRPGVNEIPIKSAERGEITRDQWIEWASPVWRGIKETNTLNAALARSEQDERHLCPLQLDLIERVVKLWSNPGETVFSPFAGIGSEGYVSVSLGRNFVGTELKPEYANRAQYNLTEAEALKNSSQADFFGGPTSRSFHV